MILCWILFIPFAGGLLCWLTGRRGGPDIPRWIALVCMVVVLALVLWQWAAGDYSLPGVGGAPQWSQQIQGRGIPSLGISFHLALDGLSVVMLLLAGFMGVLAVACSWRQIKTQVGLFYAHLLWVLGCVIGIFLSIDLFLFFFFWEMVYIPMFFLIALWGHSGSQLRQHRAAAIKFFIYTQTSSLLLLAAILGLVFVHYAQSHVLSFDYNALLGTDPGGGLGYALMLGFFIAFAVKLPAVPLHGWLPDAQTQAPTGGGFDLAAILVKTAPYSLLRFALPLFPQASHAFAPIGLALGLIGIYYGAITAFAQNDMKRLMSYSSISHMGFVLIGLYAGSVLALQGVLIQIVASALSTAALFIISGQVFERMGTRDMRRLGGLFGRLGSLPGFALVFVIATLGMPGTGNFIGEFLIMFGAFSSVPWVVAVGSVGFILTLIYALTLMHRVYWGPPSGESTLARMDSREYGMLLLLLILTLIVGLYPESILAVSQSTMTEITHWFASPTSLIL